MNFEIESAFQDDPVNLMLDGKILLESRVTTNHTINLAWSSGFQKLTRDRHMVHFALVEHAVQKDYAIDASNDTSTVLMQFDRNTLTIGIQQIKGLWLRE